MPLPISPDDFNTGKNCRKQSGGERRENHERRTGEEGETTKDTKNTKGEEKADAAAADLILPYFPSPFSLFPFSLLPSSRLTIHPPAG
jgi:hypothetical protein